MGRLTDLVVISGFSGAGKSSAMNVFDDAGYFCVDNLPPGMIRSLASLFLHEGSKVERACVVSDLRAGDYFEEIVAVLPNPQWEPDLRPLTGFDRRIVDYVGRDGRLKEFYDRVLPLLEYLLPQYVAEGKAHLVVAIGCTGGRHRSVVIAEDLAAHF